MQSPIFRKQIDPGAHPETAKPKFPTTANRKRSLRHQATHSAPFNPLALEQEPIFQTSNRQGVQIYHLSRRPPKNTDTTGRQTEKQAARSWPQSQPGKAFILTIEAANLARVRKYSPGDLDGLRGRNMQPERVQQAPRLYIHAPGETP